MNERYVNTKIDKTCWICNWSLEKRGAGTYCHNPTCPTNSFDSSVGSWMLIGVLGRYGRAMAEASPLDEDDLDALRESVRD